MHSFRIKQFDEAMSLHMTQFSHDASVLALENVDSAVSAALKSF